MRYICILREVSFYLHAMAIAIACSFMSGHEASASDFSSDSSRVVFREKIFFHRASSDIDSEYADNRVRLETIREFCRKTGMTKIMFCVSRSTVPHHLKGTLLTMKILHSTGLHH